MSIFDVRNITTGVVVIGAGSVWSGGSHNGPTNSTFTATGVTTMVATGGEHVSTSATPGAGGVATGGQVNIAGGIGQSDESPCLGGFAAGPFGGLVGHGAKGTTGNQLLTKGEIGYCLIYEYTDASLVSGGSLVPAGVCNPYAGATAPTGWLLCYGQSISRATYSTLFTAIGTTYGTASGTTFNLPDMRGRAVAGQDDMGGTSADRLTTPLNGDTLGAVGGVETHTHTTTVSGSGTGANSFAAANPAGTTVQPTIILNYIIKT
jgi:microcystin-dependent protein